MRIKLGVPGCAIARTVERQRPITAAARGAGGPEVGRSRARRRSADKPIRPYAIKPWNAFEEFVRQRVLGKNRKRGEWREDVVFEKVVFSAPIAAGAV